MIDDSGVDSLAFDNRWGHYRMRVTSNDLKLHREMLLELTRRAAGAPALIEE